MGNFDRLLQRLEDLVNEIEALEEPARGHVRELLDGIDALHRDALGRLGALVGAAELRRLRASDPAVAWLLDLYAVGVDERAAADAALESIRPYIHSHGGAVEVLAVEAGVVRLRMTGACAGCTASSVTLREGIEQALRERFPGFAAVEVEDDDAPPHPPPGPTLVQVEGRRA